MIPDILCILKVTSVVLIPIGFWIGYIYYKDRHQPEPIKTLGFAYLLGLLSAFLALGLFALVDHLLEIDPIYLIKYDRSGFFLYAVGVIGVIEEGAKFLPFALVCIRLKDFNEAIDGVVYASMIALGFASVENLQNLYYLSGLIFYLHALVSPLVHCVFSAIWGLTYSWAAFRSTKLVWFKTGMALIAGIVIHGLYDYLSTDPEMKALSALVIFLVWLLGLFLIDRLRPKPPPTSQALAEDPTVGSNE